MPNADDVAVDSLISRLAAPLAPSDRAAFRAAAEGALAHVPCLGEGVLYRTVAPLQRVFRVPLSDHRATWDISMERPGVSKLASAPPIERGRDLRYTRRLQLTR